MLFSSPTDRRKRSAEQPLNDAEFDRNVPSETNVNQDYLELRPPTYNSHYNSHNVYPPSGHEVQPSVPTPSSHVPYMPSYDRWPSENINQFAFSGPLSTSVLPQLYSTGLVDDRGSSAGSRVHSHSDQVRASHATRYPQYWNDFSTFPQLGSAYGNFHEQAPTPQQQSSSQIYLPEPYNNLYSGTYLLSYTQLILTSYSNFIRSPVHKSIIAVLHVLLAFRQFRLVVS